MNSIYTHEEAIFLMLAAVRHSDGVLATAAEMRALIIWLDKHDEAWAKLRSTP